MAVEQEQYLKNDELKIYRGEDFVVSKYIRLHQPSLGEICDYGEQEYYSMIYNLTATPQSLKVQLWDMGIDYTEITPYELFYQMLYKLYPQERTSIIFGNLDLTKFQVMQRKDDESIFLYQEIFVGKIFNQNNELLYEFFGLEDAARFIGCEIEKLVEKLTVSDRYEDYKFTDVHLEPIVIDEYTYNMIVDYICKSHFK